jgi:hypothetical protein
MAKKNFLAIVINQNDKFYKVNSISISNDDSIHIIVNTGLSKKDEKIIPLKGTYHTSGFSHFTQGSKEFKQEIFPKKQDSHAEIEESQGLINYTVKNVNIKELDYLDVFTAFDKYKNVIEIDSKNYTHLVIQYFIAPLNFNIDKSAHLYNEVFEINLNNNKLIIATRNAKNILDLLEIYS